MKLNKGFVMTSFIFSLITISVGLTLCYIIPTYVQSSLNTSLGCQTWVNASNHAQGCTTWYSDNASTPVSQVVAIGLVVVIIGMIWMIVSVVSGGA